MLNLNHNRITKVLTATFLTAMSAQPFAATLSDATISVTVQNAFDLVEDTELSFGTIRATADPAGTNVATLAIAADGSVTATPDNNATITQLTAGSVGQFTVSNAATFTDLTITFPGAATTLDNAIAPPTSPDFTVDTWVAIVRGGANDGVAYNAGAPNLQTDNTGTVSFDVGATLSTDANVTTSAYIDDVYDGDYTITVDY
ncbi:DUF4402 domain-containing protein [Thalassomonas sp. RHCl1]|uniref:DUF4402 domain-containing protein n=1 Tax=Thalassomonas sp. RHCl1 TaxID=2995320 RepID=UPI00248C8366|nr:DUF4402 domain-containing protein [Thalassomonas sp. RHCl1]